MKKLGIVILNWNGHIDTVECLKSIHKHEDKDLTIYVFDNGSKAESKAYIRDNIGKHKLNFCTISSKEFLQLTKLEAHSHYFIEHDKNLGFAKGNNFVLRKIVSDHDYIMLLNNDTIITKQALSNMVHYMDEHREIGFCSCNIKHYDSRKLWNAGGKLTWYGERKYHSEKKIMSLQERGIQAIPCSFITGCAIVIRNTLLKKHGLLTEQFFFGEEDFNLCKRLQKHDIKGVSLLDVVIYHKVSSSINRISQNQYNLGKIAVHHINRTIDNRNFFIKPIWNLWYVIYLLLLSIKCFQWRINFKDTLRLLHTIHFYTKRYDQVDETTFLSILNTFKE